MKRRAPTDQEILRNVKRRVRYGFDERARFVEHVCGLLLTDRFGPGAADDMIVIEEHAEEDAPPSCLELSAPGITAACWTKFDRRGEQCLLNHPPAGRNDTAFPASRTSKVLGRIAQQHPP